MLRRRLPTCTCGEIVEVVRTSRHLAGLGTAIATSGPLCVCVPVRPDQYAWSLRLIVSHQPFPPPPSRSRPCRGAAPSLSATICLVAEPPEEPPVTAAPRPSHRGGLRAWRRADSGDRRAERVRAAPGGSARAGSGRRRDVRRVRLGAHHGWARSGSARSSRASRWSRRSPRGEARRFSACTGRWRCARRCGRVARRRPTRPAPGADARLRPSARRSASACSIRTSTSTPSCSSAASPRSTSSRCAAGSRSERGWRRSCGSRRWASAQGCSRPCFAGRPRGASSICWSPASMWWIAARSVLGQLR